MKRINMPNSSAVARLESGGDFRIRKLVADPTCSYVVGEVVLGVYDVAASLAAGEPLPFTYLRIRRVALARLCDLTSLSVLESEGYVGIESYRRFWEQTCYTGIWEDNPATWVLTVIAATPTEIDAARYRALLEGNVSVVFPTFPDTQFTLTNELADVRVWARSS